MNVNAFKYVSESLLTLLVTTTLLWVLTYILQM